MADPLDPPDEQDQSEVFDETHLDDEGDGDVTLDEMEDVLDVTQIDGDAEDDDLDLDDVQALDGVDAAADSSLNAEGTPLNEQDEDSDDLSGPDEVELVYSGLMRNVKGAQASAAHWEARRLDDDDIDALGYAPDSEKPSQENP